MNNEYQSWGKFPKALPKEIRYLKWKTDKISLSSTSPPALAYGKGRSYGDVCLNDQGIIFDTSSLNHIIELNEKEETFRCEAGLSFSRILEFLVPQGWFLPVTPGTKYITLGGAIANDVHGKNHHRQGSFGSHVLSFQLLRSDGTTPICSLEKNSELFRATIGGLGLTGIILWAKFRLKKISSPFLLMESFRMRNLKDFFRFTEESDKKFEYTVSWLDCLAKGKEMGRGIFMRANHAKADSLSKASAAPGKPLFHVPFHAPSFLLNPISCKLFNGIYFHKHPKKTVKKMTHYDPFFYPLDVIGSWNRFYGKRGFFQHQSVIPLHRSQQGIERLLSAVSKSALGSFLSVMKKFGDKPSPGLLSFPMPGITVALDFPNLGEKSFRLFEQLDKIIAEEGGRVYPAKDARMSSENFKKFFPSWELLEKQRDPNFSSGFWRRVIER